MRERTELEIEETEKQWKGESDFFATRTKYKYYRQKDRPKAADRQPDRTEKRLLTHYRNGPPATLFDNGKWTRVYEEIGYNAAYPFVRRRVARIRDSSTTLSGGIEVSQSGQQKTNLIV